MVETEQAQDGRATARELLRFLDELMRTIARVDLGDAGAAQLTLLEMRILTVLGDSGLATELREIAELTKTSVGHSGHASDRLRSRGLVERAGAGRGRERAFAITRRGRRLLASLDAGRQAAVEGLISGLGRTERLRLQGAAHLLGRDLDRLSTGFLPA